MAESPLLLTCDVITIFPELIEGAVRFGVLRRAQESGGLLVRAVDLRDHATDRHRTVDDYPYGGEPGMLMKPEPIAAAVRDVRERASTPPPWCF